jgi:arylformamidase
MALITDWERDYGLPASVIKGGCSVSGIYQLEPLRQSYHQPFLRLDDASVRSMSPQLNIPQYAPPLLLAVGSEEPDEFRRQQSEFATTWRQAGLQQLEVPLPGRHHFSAVDALGEADHPLHAAVCHLARRGRLS